MRPSPSPFLLLLTATACHRDDFEVEVTVDDAVPSIVHLAWSTDVPGRSWVEYAGPEDETMSTPVVDDGATEHAATLLGLPFLQECEWRAVTEVDGDELWAGGTVETGGMPSAFPDLRLVSWDEDRASDERFFAGTYLDSVGLFAIDREGQYRWFHEFGRFLLPDFDLSQDGTLLFSSYSIDRTVDLGEIHEVSWDGSVSVDRRLVLGHHSFAELPDGTIAYVAVDIRDWYDPIEGALVPVVGDRISILPADGGDPWTFFSTWDWRDPQVHDRWNDGFYEDLGADWTHANAVRYDEQTDSYLLSLRNMDTVLEIDGSTAQVLREFGRSGYTFGSGSFEFSFQHDPNWTPERTLLMLSTDEEVKQTWAVEYLVDPDARVLREVWRHGDDESIYAQYQGGVRILSNGNRLVNFGSAGVLQEVTEDGDVVWEVRGGTGAAFGATRAFESFYDPS